jgi:hypothetical protein
MYLTRFYFIFISALLGMASTNTVLFHFYFCITLHGVYQRKQADSWFLGLVSAGTTIDTSELCFSHVIFFFLYFLGVSQLWTYAPFAWTATLVRAQWFLLHQLTNAIKEIQKVRTAICHHRSKRRKMPLNALSQVYALLQVYKYQVGLCCAPTSDLSKMPQSPFSKEQNKLIATYYLAWEEAIEEDVNLADWKKQMATIILANPLFVGKLDGADPVTWEQVRVGSERRRPC